MINAVTHIIRAEEAAGTNTFVPALPATLRDRSGCLVQL